MVKAISKSSICRTQNLINKGQWIIKSRPVFELAVESLMDNYSAYMKDDEANCKYLNRCFNAIDLLHDLYKGLNDLEYIDEDSEFVGPVTLPLDFGCSGKEEEIIPAIINTAKKNLKKEVA